MSSKSTPAAGFLLREKKGHSTVYGAGGHERISTGGRWAQGVQEAVTQEAGAYTESRWAQEMAAYRKQVGTASRAGQKQQPGHWIPLKARIDEGFSWAPFPDPRPRAALGIWVWKKWGDRELSPKMNSRSQAYSRWRFILGRWSVSDCSSDIPSCPRGTVLTPKEEMRSLCPEVLPGTSGCFLES